MRRLVFVAALIGGFAALASLFGRAYLAKELSGNCRPCDATADCNPISLSLEVSTPSPRINTTYTVWHRVRLTNVSCLTLQDIESSQIQTSGEMTSVRRLLGQGLYFKAWDPQGREILPFAIIPPAKLLDSHVGQVPGYADDFRKTGLNEAVVTGSGRSEFGDVIPYQFGSNPVLPSEPGIEEKPDGRADLLPGGVIESLPSVLAPVRLRQVLVGLPEDPSGRVGSAFATGVSSAPVPAGAQRPPEGFQILKGYVFRTPGRYRIEVLYSGKIRSRFNRPRYERLSKPTRRILYWLSHVPGLDIRPVVYGPEFNITVRSAPVEFEVRP